MFLDAEIIYEELQNIFDFQLIKGTFQQKVRGICCVKPDNLSGGNMLIVNGEQYSRLLHDIQHSVIVVLSDQPVQDSNPSNDILVFPAKTDIPKLMSTVTEVIMVYDKWAEDICLCENSFSGIKKMMDISRQFTKGTFVLADINLYYLYYTKDFLQYGFLDNQHNDLPTDDIVKMLLSDENYQSTFENKDVFLFPDYKYSISALCWNVFGKNEAAQARLMFVTKEKNYGPKESFVLRYLGQQIEKTIEANPVYTFPIRAYQRFRESVASLMEGIPLDKNAVEKNLKKLGWKSSDWFRVFVFNQPGNKSQQIALDILCSSAEVLFAGGFAAVLDGRIYLITNESLNPISDIENKLAFFCESYRVLVGVSDKYADLYKTYFAAQTAKAAVEIGLGKESHSRCFYFEDCTLAYLIRYGTKNMSEEFVIHPVIKRLRQYDAENGTTYIETLKIFLDENGSATHTARRLYIHRSTLLERIERMKAIGGLDNFFEWKTKLHLMLSLTDPE